MSQIVVNEDMFGKYCTIPTGCSREEHTYKIVARIESNTYCDVPLFSGATEETTHESVIPVLLVIHCGIDESKVIRVPLAKCKICAAPNGWISVNDRLPDTSRYVIICLETGDMHCGWYGPNLQIWFDENATKIESVTHWRELPDPPRMEENKNTVRKAILAHKK